MTTISAVIITKNEARDIQRCLESLQGVVDEIVVVDSFSEDETAQICQKFGVVFKQIEWKGYSETKNDANQLATSDYILSLDGDEVLSASLRNSILAVKGNLTGIYRFHRLNHYLGEPITCCGWYPDTKIRLFPKERTYWKGEVHEELIFSEKPPNSLLQGDLLHFPYHSIDDHVKQTLKYAELGALKIADSNQKRLFLKSLVNPIWRFFRMYFIKGGIKAGKAGWMISRMAMKEVKMKYRGAIKIRNTK